MSIPKYSLDNKAVINFFLLVLLFGGIASYSRLGKKEDSPFVIKTAVLMVRYPGASPSEVEKLITEPIEREIQSMKNIEKIESTSFFGMSKIMITFLPTVSPNEIPQYWDELRRKILNIQPRLPEGASEIMVNDDFGDVYGIYYALTADDGFNYQELRDWAEKVKSELVTIPGVVRVSLFGDLQEVVNVYISIPKLANLGINPSDIAQTLQAQNKLVNVGTVPADDYQLTIYAEGTYQNLEDIRNQLITSKDGQVKLRDIARVEKGYNEPPSTLMRMNNQKAIGIGVASDMTKDVVSIGRVVNERLKELTSIIPIGIEINSVYPEDIIAEEANLGFIINVIVSVLIVVIIIMLVMGFKASILIGSSLFFSIAGTLLIMLFINVGLNRTSLAGFIIAMGMLVDNAIVVTDNAQNALKRGVPLRKALIDGARIPQMPLLGATIIAILSFLPLYLAAASVAEIVNPLFIVLAISLGLSWILALTQTPIFGSYVLKSNKNTVISDPYNSKLFKIVSRFLERLIANRWLVLSSMIGLLFLSIFVMGIMPQSFFPSLDKPFFRADMVFPEGYSIRAVEKDIIKIESWLMKQPSVKNVSFTMGNSPLRYYLASVSYGPQANYANALVELTTADSTSSLENRFNSYMKHNYPDTYTNSMLFKMSPGIEASIEIGFVGSNVDTLEMLTNKVLGIMRNDGKYENIRPSWGNKIPVLVPKYSQEKGQRAGVSRHEMAQSISIVTTGHPIGNYRERDVFMPILLKDNDIDNFNLSNITTLPVQTAKGAVIPIEQIIEKLSVEYEYSKILRRNRQNIMLARCEPKRGINSAEAFNSIWSQVKDSIDVPNDYKLLYLGERENQDISNAAILNKLPLILITTFIILLLLFGNYRKPIMIMLMIPLIFIGVVFGLLVLGKSFDFFAILGLLGLIGMNVKNAIVLVDQIGIELEAGKSEYKAVVDASISRIVPVAMASGTTILGMAPLLLDSMFGGMAATIMGGLLVASLLTIFVLPVTYCVFYKVKKD